MIIHYLAAGYDNFEKKYSSYFKGNGMNLKPFTIDETQHISCFLLLTPTLASGSFVSTGLVWKNYLLKKNPECKLIIAGYEKSSLPNYIDLLNLPDDLSLFMTQLRTLAQHWTPYESGNINLHDKLKKFFDGHHGESVAEVFNLFRRRLALIVNEFSETEVELSTILADINEAIDFSQLENGTQVGIWENILSNWQLFKLRWKNYKKWFSILPIHQDFEKLEIELNTLEEFLFQKFLSKQIIIKAFEQVEKTKEELMQIQKLYVTTN